jgi:hypothetical protein
METPPLVLSQARPVHHAVLRVSPNWFPSPRKGEGREGVGPAPPEWSQAPVNPRPALRAELPLSGGGMMKEQT